MHPRRSASPAPGQGPPPLSPFETWIAFPILFTACVYNALQLVPVALLPPTLARVLGNPSDLFRLARLATTTPTRELREALAPEGWLASAMIVRLWRADYGVQAIENLLWRLSSVDGRVRVATDTETLPRAWRGAADGVCLLRIGCRI